MAEKEKEKRGRPKKQTNVFDVPGLLCEYLTTKVDKYDNEISFYKVIDDSFKIKMKSILKEMCEECRMPFWKTEDHEYILKVKTKNTHTPKKKLENHDIVSLNLSFKYYRMETDNGLLQGYFAKITSYEEDKENNN